MRYLPVTTKLKLNKRFRALEKEEEDDTKIKNIVIAGRSLTTGEIASIKSSLDLAGRPS